MGAPLLRSRGCFLVLCLLVGPLSFQCSTAATQSERTAIVVGAGDCLDCAEKNIKTEDAFKGLHVAIKCKTTNGNYETQGSSELDNKGEFSVPLSADLLNADGELRDECFAQLHGISAAPCPSPDGRLSPSKLAFQSKENGKHTFTAATGKLSFSSATCASAFLWHFLKHPLPKWHPLHKHFPWHKPYYPPKSYSPPIYTPPVYTPPVYAPHPVYKPPVYKPPVYKPPAPVYKPPVYKPPVYKPPVYKPLPPLVPVYKPPIYSKPPCPPLPKFPPIYKKPWPPMPPIYKKPWPPMPPIYKKPWPPMPQLPPHHKFEFPPIYKKPWPPMPPLSFHKKDPFFPPSKDSKP